MLYYGEGNGTPLQYSCLENPMDRGARWAAVHGIATSQTQLSDFTFTFHFHFSLSCIGGGNGNPLQCSCLENPRDGGAWWAALYGVAQSRTRLKQLSSNSSSALLYIRDKYAKGCWAGNQKSWILESEELDSLLPLANIMQITFPFWASVSYL